MVGVVAKRNCWLEILAVHINLDSPGSPNSINPELSAPLSKSQNPNPSTSSAAATITADDMGGRGGDGGGRKARNFATFRLFPRAGAADPNDRVFVRVDNNDYTVPGFADEDSFDPSLSDPSAGDVNFHSASGSLPEHVRREILELGLPDDGYNYLSHLRELRPTAAAASSFVPSSTARPEPLPLDVKVTLISAKAPVLSEPERLSFFPPSLCAGL